jgi:hypothetical protein
VQNILQGFDTSFDIKMMVKISILESFSYTKIEYKREILVCLGENMYC